MSGSAGFHWEVNGQEIFIYFSMCRNGCWTDWNYDEDNLPFVFGKHEKDESEYFEANYYSGIEFKYINQKIKIRMTPQDLKSLSIKNAISLIQTLELPCKIPAILKSNPKEESLYWAVESSPSYKSIFLKFEYCHSGKWVNSKEEPKCEFIDLTETDENEEDEEDIYYYTFNSGIEFNYLDDRITITAEQLEDLDVDTVSMLLQVLNLNAT